MAGWKRIFIRPESEAVRDTVFTDRDTRLIEIIDRAVAIVVEVTTQPIEIKRKWVGDVLLEVGCKPAGLGALRARATARIERRIAARRKEASGLEEEIRELRTRLALLRKQIPEDEARQKDLEINIKKLASMFEVKIDS